jgi:biotin carboxyl carrier protein
VTRVGVAAEPGDIDWIRDAAGSLGVDTDLATARVLVAAPDHAARLPARTSVPVVVIGDPTQPADPRIAHVIRRGLPPGQVFELLASLAGWRPVRPAPGEPTTPAAARDAQSAFAESRRLAAAADPAEMETAAVAAVLNLVGSDRAHCLYHDPEDGALWSEAHTGERGDERRAVAGLVGFAARTGTAIATARVGGDLRWAPAIDDAAGDAGDRMLVQPVIAPSGVVHAILVAVRAGRRPEFDEQDVERLARYAALAAPFIEQLSCHQHARAIVEAASGTDSLFRTEAVVAQGVTSWGDVVRVTPAWIGWTYWVLVALLLVAAVFVSVGTVATYSAGPAVVRATARTDVVARTAGNIAAVERAPGDRVAAGAVIARLDDENERAALSRAERELDSQLRNHLLDPADTGTDGALRRLQQAREAARTALEDRIVRAGSSGTIADLRVRPGQHVTPGDIVGSIVDGSGGLEVIALLPGEDRPQLAPGMRMRLELHGYRYDYQSLAIEGVSSDVIGPTEARRVLGPEIADSVELGGPVVVIRGRLSRDVFEADGRTFRYHDGMLGTAEVQVRRERMLFLLFPAARRL